MYLNEGHISQMLAQTAKEPNGKTAPPRRGETGVQQIKAP